MTNLIGGVKLTYNVKGNTFKSLDELINNLNEYAMDVEDEIDSAAALDAADIAENLASNYEVYMSNYGPGGLYETQGLGSFLETSNIKLKKHGGTWYGAPSLYVTKIRGGYSVTLSGKDVLYHEFGTGSVGKSDGYPKRSELYKNAQWAYLVGSKILKSGGYLNGSSLADTIPSWYTKALEQKIIRKSDAVWMSPFGITKGNHAGMFMYDTFMEYIEDLNDDSSTAGKAHLGKRSLSVMTRNKILTGKWK